MESFFETDLSRSTSTSSSACDFFDSSEKTLRNVANSSSSNRERFHVSDKTTSDGSDGLASASDDVTLSVYWKRGKLGAAYYVSSDAEVYLLNDVVDVHPDFNNLKCLLHQVNYGQVVTISDLSDSFTNLLKELVRMKHLADTSADGEYVPDKLHFIPGRKNDINYDSCKRHVLARHFEFEPKFSNEEERLIFVNTYIDFKNESLVMSLGVLLKFLEKNLPQANLSHSDFRIRMLYHMNLENMVSVDEVSYKALQIFNEVHHPSAFKRHGYRSNREGLSVFGIFSRCKSKIGPRKMREIFTSPSKDIDKLNARLKAIEFLTKPQHEHIVKSLVGCVKKVESVTGILTNMYRSRSNMNHWKSLYSSMYNAILIGQICEKYSSCSTLFAKIANSITREIQESTHHMNIVIDFEESSTRNRFTVRSGVDRKLDKMRQIYAQVPDVLTKVAELELRDLPEFIASCSLVYITELGYLLSVPIWKGNGKSTREYALPDFDVKFILNDYVHYKTPRCAELDRTLGDCLARICKIESKIMVSLTEFIQERVPYIVEAIKFIAELDCVLAMAFVATENNYTRPILTKERKLEIIQGRHPLQELCVENFVPNNAQFDATNGTIKILTGPNASGKSVYLKQIALITFLSHIGSFVPAQRATIGILDHIHLRIHTPESISTRMSSFVLDVKQLSHSLYNSSASSLIIIDEFGRGTSEIDGLSLLAASLIHFIERESNCPFILVSTHFHDLPQLMPESSMIKLQYMDYAIEGNEIVYLHRIKDGTCTSKLVHLAAKNAGLSEESVARFLQVMSKDRKLTCNPNLRITKRMTAEMKSMIDMLDLGTDIGDKIL